MQTCENYKEHTLSNAKRHKLWKDVSIFAQIASKGAIQLDFIAKA